MAVAGAYYNDLDPFAAEWLRNLIRTGLIAPGDVDERDIRTVQPEDVRAYTQCHFFAGLGGWSYALRLAGWPDNRPVWTGSCPCQPFSAAGKGAGTADARHLWPEFRRLIAHGTPAVVFGEQVASALGRQWLSTVRLDLEGLGYGVGAADLCAAGAGAPHIRQRLWFVADSLSAGRPEWGAESGNGSAARGSRSGELANAEPQYDGAGLGRKRGRFEDSNRRADGVVGVAHDAGPQGHGRYVGINGQEGWQVAAGHQPAVSFWHDADWIPCRDGKARPVEPGTFPLAHGVPSRVGRLRAYGNAIVPEVAATFIDAYLGRLDLIEDWI